MTTYTLNNVIDDFHFTMLKIAAVYYYLAALPVHSTPKPNRWAKVSINLSLTRLNLQFPFLVPFHSSPIGNTRFALCANYHGNTFQISTCKAIHSSASTKKAVLSAYARRKSKRQRDSPNSTSVRSHTHTYVRTQTNTHARTRICNLRAHYHPSLVSLPCIDYVAIVIEFFLSWPRVYNTYLAQSLGDRSLPKTRKSFLQPYHLRGSLIRLRRTTKD